MASRVFLQQRIAPVATGAALAGLALFPKTALHAEAPEETRSRKPIYDEYETPAAPATSLPSSEKSFPAPAKTASPTPTDRLAVQIRKTRLFLYSHVLAAETKVNQLMDSALDLEDSFTSTVASLAPTPQSGEKLMPGTLYVLVAAMTGSIVSRNRNILLRATVPLAVGIGAGWVVLPVTMRNVSDLLWKYEQRFPAVADGHIRTRESIEKAWRMARIHTQQAVDVVDEKVTSGRGAVEDWVKKGK
ncbi:uncharacterized protein L3040_006351 [Drepanopeziza brunnea f. sp. 'multigermtubi']|uniref:MICOS complex subunit n=1 Tax=Marssonina brunnea f. sp. multigermtubi (strain MB_m1) TaxID=1072389 RepID=K1X685_MARBU|nr:uncharacterized protein MBM_01309 [Drepanopeziza brunnea f. sp. 'multigermtubi' MB_m1]EKD20627.1 hypothetical protein MBM_01309 [Drepanopeziza brunnea f. sp. 'multigermtubi' MB_m1]KAJ5038671.1 hypothetical protein L3040_006351 [Drepanopeziza brunnea f. sp. 'multigermtubi']